MAERSPRQLPHRIGIQEAERRRTAVDRHQHCFVQSDARAILLGARHRREGIDSLQQSHQLAGDRHSLAGPEQLDMLAPGDRHLCERKRFIAPDEGIVADAHGERSHLPFLTGAKPCLHLGESGAHDWATAVCRVILGIVAGDVIDLAGRVGRHWHQARMLRFGGARKAVLA